jgi:hypothetical protein
LCEEFSNPLFEEINPNTLYKKKKNKNSNAVIKSQKSDSKIMFL